MPIRIPVIGRRHRDIEKREIPMPKAGTLIQIHGKKA